MKLKKKQLSSEEKEHREKMFMWAVVVIIVNAISIFFKGVVFLQVAALVVTVYALYRMVVYENKNNRNSRKYFDWTGRPLSHQKNDNKNLN
jgi:Ca2+/Na+ antiporter